ncbi:MHS family MFS transporter [Spongiibacter nanhainus]|uniref:MHS family MFS transporter n=1 Tax=Spongiibacter nanhainus TaxID=2794344 RepID=A0A7T4UP95_9GAMM|nr:MFS transporter [Spongiibacter nanhainus]QQD17418.1 MHS family MFS transporter [Spongiibacter nanhainus]
MTQTTEQQRQARKVLLASFIGTTFEWYDFFIYASAAALVFAPLFFPDVSDLVGQLAAFSTFAVGFIARPIGGLVVGHFGDRVGRKSMLVFCLLSMGIATVLIGCLPTYHDIGIWAPILLVVLRIFQGIGVGGEWGGAVLMAVEYAPPNRRGLYGGFVQIGTPAGLILANIAFLGALALVPEDQFLVWGWRVPFLLSAILVIIGLVIRLQIEETPIYASAKRRDTSGERLPILEVLKSHWRPVITGGLAHSSTTMIGYVLIAYILSYGVGVLGMAKSTMVTLVLVASAVWLLTCLIFAAWSDRLGRRRIYIAGSIAALAWVFPFFLLIDTMNVWLMGVALIGLALALAAMYSPIAALLSELFPTRVRYTGNSLSYQVGTLFGGAFVPVIATSLYHAFGTSMAVSAYMFISVLIGFLAILFVPETSRIDIN